MISLPIRDNFQTEEEYLEALSECKELVRIHNINNPDALIEMSKEERLLELKNNLGIK